MQQLPLLDHSTQIKGNSRQSWAKEILAALEVRGETNWIDEFGEALRRWCKANVEPIRTLSLFTGGGGLDLGFHDVGFQIEEMVEIEKKYALTLTENSSGSGLLAGSRPTCTDIKEYYPREDLGIDFIIGGPPCQTFSAAGRRAAGVLGTDDPRGTLFEEYVRILQCLKPKGFLYENVYGIVGAQKGKAWRKILKAFEEAGYRVHHRILDSADYGVPQHRERLFIVGLRDSEFLFPRPTHGEDAVGFEPHFSAQEAIDGVDTSHANSGLNGEYGHLLDDIPPGLNYSFYTEKMGHPDPVFAWRSKFSDFLYKADPERPVRTLKAQGGQYTGPFSWENRPFTIAELKRLQTFPDRYRIVGNRQACVEQIGNSVPPQMARLLALAILDQAYEIKLPFKMHYLRESEKLGFRSRKRFLTGVYREKARVAIEKLNSTVPLTHPNDFKLSTIRETRYITPDFRTSLSQLENGARVFLRYTLDFQQWTISANSRNEFDTEPTYEAVILPKEGERWVVPAKKVSLQGFNKSDFVFTCLWKAFENHLKAVTGTADLVQLFGYYQYPSRMKIQFQLGNKIVYEPNWHALRHIVDGRGVAKQIPGLALSEILEMEQEELMDFLSWLRTLGYEVRNRNTNSQLEKSNFLIPYSFPTLSHRSVQLHKRLRD